LNLEAGKRREYFMKLRTGYRMRREFINWTVQLPDKCQSTEQTLKKLGFKTNIVSHA